MAVGDARADGVQGSLAGPVLLYDGGCGLCAESVQWILRRDRRRTLRFAALEGRYAAGVRAVHPELRGIDSVVWVEPIARGGRSLSDDDGVGGREGKGERVLVRSDAALAAAVYVGGAWRLSALARVVPRGMRDLVYRFVARHRHRFSGGRVACVVPAPEDRGRFLD